MAKQSCYSVGMTHWQEDNRVVLIRRWLYSRPLNIYDFVCCEDALSWPADPTHQTYIRLSAILLVSVTLNVSHVDSVVRLAFLHRVYSPTVLYLLHLTRVQCRGLWFANPHYDYPYKNRRWCRLSQPDAHFHTSTSRRWEVCVHISDNSGVANRSDS